MNYEPTYPVCLHLSGRKVIVIGGGPVAERKALGLLEVGAIVEVVSPALTEELNRLSEQGRIYHLQRNYEQGDLVGGALIICACGDPEVNKRVVAEARREGIFCNVVDEPELCSFIVPAVLRRGMLMIAISTSGACPALAKKLRCRLEQQFGPEYGDLLQTLHEFRKQLQQKYPENEQKRKQKLEKLLDKLLSELSSNN
ncbi:MAG: bifunctional precorrin-2 dehydrogenase/sirohydrochlorin ferrochelatase [Sedimentisphaerales bacterium]|nr:bifunctional precorrin-2 dehydrogenase/sirohydrochlorin ferrochelatase [Sedimentisphaerales bacterium]